MTAHRSHAEFYMTQRTFLGMFLIAMTVHSIQIEFYMTKF